MTRSKQTSSKSKLDCSETEPTNSPIPTATIIEPTEDPVVQTDAPPPPKAKAPTRNLRSRFRKEQLANGTATVADIAKINRFGRAVPQNFTDPISEDPAAATHAEIEMRKSATTSKPGGKTLAERSIDPKTKVEQIVNDWYESSNKGDISNGHGDGQGYLNYKEKSDSSNDESSPKKKPKQNGSRGAYPAEEEIPKEIETFRDKYQHLKRKFKDVLHENGKLSDEYNREMKKLKIIKAQRDMALDRMLELHGYDAELIDSSSTSSRQFSSEEGFGGNHPQTKLKRSLKAKAKAVASSVPLQTKKSGSKDGSSGTGPIRRARKAVRSSPIADNNGAGKKKTGKRAPSLAMNPKNKKARKVDKDVTGNYVLPVQVGLHTVVDLGRVLWDRPKYHNERYIYPVGYTVKRPYNSMIDPNSETIYFSRIEDGGEAPRFIVQAEDNPGNPIIASSATGAWTPVIKQANAIRQRKHSNAASGPDYFGFSQPTIRKMIQELPNAEKCENYIMKEFEIMEGESSGRRGRRGGGGSTNIKIESED